MYSVNLSGRVALVTGGGRGIGRALARGIAECGAIVAVNDIDEQAAAMTAGIGEGRLTVFAADVADPAAVQRMVDEIMTAFGRLDILVNNAGVEPSAPVLEMTIAEWQRTLDVNLSAAFYTSQAVGRVMREAGRGVIVNIASIAGHNIPLRDRSAYVASKAGLIGFTRECAREFAGYGIRVNAVCPGVIETDMTAHRRSDAAQMAKWLADIPLGRLGLPEDVLGLTLFLCSDASRYIIGQAINVDGGKVML